MERTAKKEFREWLQEYEHGKVGSPRQRATLGEVGGKYLEYREHRVSSSWLKRQRMYLETHVYPILGKETLIARITEEDLEGYISERLAKGVKKVTVNKELSALRRLFSFARQRRYRSDDPTTHLERLREDDAVPHDRVLSAEEAGRLVAAAPSPMREFITVGIGTGLRSGELKALKWSNVSFEGRALHVVNDPGRGHHTKTLEERWVPIVPIVENALRALPRHVNSAYVFFRKDGSPWVNFRKPFDKAVKDAGLAVKPDHPQPKRAKVTPHTMRHTYVTRLAEAGFDPYRIMQWSGHKLLDTVQRYVNMAGAKQAVRRVERIDEVVFLKEERCEASSRG